MREKGPGWRLVFLVVIEAGEERMSTAVGFIRVWGRLVCGALRWEKESCDCLLACDSIQS